MLSCVSRYLANGLAHTQAVHTRHSLRASRKCSLGSRLAIYMHFDHKNHERPVNDNQCFYTYRQISTRLPQHQPQLESKNIASKANPSVLVPWYWLFPYLLPEARVGGHGYSSMLVCLLPEARVGGHGYSSLLVCLFVCLFVCLSQVYLLTWMPHHCVYSMDSLHTTIS